MKRIRVKFCGVTRSEDLAVAAGLGVDAIGLVLTPRSKRCLGLEQARALRAAMPPFVAAVALFMDDEPRWINEVVSVVRPDLLQFHGSESPAECTRYGCRYVKAIGMADAADPRAAIDAHAAAAGFLLDSHGSGEQGGSGRAFDWARAPMGISRPLILAGGLTCDNVASAIRAVRPYAVDVSSGIERSPGIKDAEKMRRFIEEVERACNESEN